MAGPLFFSGVCETSATTGTGPFTLTGAVSGSSTFAGAGMAAGDTFFYSAVNIDNPTQVEVGLGTWRADGKIDRANRSGKLVDFSAGSKQIYLVQLAPQPVIIQGGGGSSSGGLTNTELRATPVPINGTVTANVPNGLDVDVLTLPALPAGANNIGSVNVANFPATQPVSGTVGISGTVPVSGPLTDTQLRATALPVSGTFWQATQPVSIAATVAVSGPLTDTQLRASTISARAPKDTSRASVSFTAEFTFAQTAETLLSLTRAVDGGAGAAGTSFLLTSGKRLRIQAISIEVEALGSGTAPQRAYLRLRRNNAGATVAGSNLIGVWACVNNPAVVKTGQAQHYDFPDGYEMLGDGTATFGFTLETPDWVTTTATGRAKITILGFEYTP